MSDAFNPDAFIEQTDQHISAVQPQMQQPTQPHQVVPGQPVTQTDVQNFDPDMFVNDIKNNQDNAEQAEYGTGSQQLKAGLEGAGRGVGSVAFTAAEKAFGVKEKDILAREHANPGTAALAEVSSLVGSSILTGGATAPLRAAKLATIGGLAEHVGAGIANKLLPKAALAGAEAVTKIPVLRQMGRAAVQMGIENAVITAGDETSRMILHDPETTASSAMMNVGLSGMLGGVLGGAVGAVSPLFKASKSADLGKLADDFLSRKDFHANNPDLSATLVDNIQNVHDSFLKGADVAYERGGLKAEEIGKLLPKTEAALDKSFEMASGIHGEMSKVINSLEESGANKSLVNDLKNSFSTYETKALEGVEGKDIFKIHDSINELKQDIGKMSKMEKGSIANFSEGKALEKVRSFGTGLKDSLENSEVWGKAADLQKNINEAYSGVLGVKNKTGPLNQLRQTFMQKVGEDFRVDPSKVDKYLKQIGNSKADIPQSKVVNFLDSSDTFHKAIDNIYTKNGLENPISRVSTETMRATTGKLEPGAKLFDWLINKGLGEGAGGAMGAAAGHKIGLGWVGGMLGAHALGPMINSVLPGIVTKLANTAANGTGLRAALDYGIQAAKGQTMLSKVTKSVFKAIGQEAVEKGVAIRDNEKLDKKVKDYGINPDKLQSLGVDLSHYMPDHTTALASITAGAIKYLNQIRPNDSKASPLDNKPVVNRVAKLDYNRALNIAQDPMAVIKNINTGTINQRDVVHFKAMYPALYENARSKIMSDMTDHLTKNDNIPYRVKIGLSVFLGTPLDSTMTQAGIAAAQPQHVPEQQPSQVGIPNSGMGKPPPAASMKGMSKLPSLYQTDNQKREASRTKH